MLGLVVDGDKGWGGNDGRLELFHGVIMLILPNKVSVFSCEIDERSSYQSTIEEKSLIQMHMVPAVPRNVRTSETVLHGSQLRTLDTLELSGTWPSYVHL